VNGITADQVCWLEEPDDRTLGDGGQPPDHRS
jgi:hypothetical protein